MSSVSSLDTRRALGRAEVADPIELTPAPIELSDLVAAMNDRTRELLSRKTRSRRSWLVPRALLAADLAGLTLAYSAATLISGNQGALGSVRELTLFLLTLPCWVIVAKLQGLYQRDLERADHATTDDIFHVFNLATIGIWLLVVISRVAGRDGPGIYALIALWALSIVLVPLARTIARALCARSEAYQQNTVIVGAGEVGQLIGRKLLKHPEYGLNVVGFADRHPRMRRADLPEDLCVLGGPEDLPDIIRTLDVERVVIAFSTVSTPELLMLLRSLRPLEVQIDLVPRLFELVGPKIAMHSVEGITMVGLPPSSNTQLQRAIKRGIDIAGASIGLILSAPLLAYIALRVRLDSSGPVLFRQTRMGRGMKEFTALKFRTMKVDVDQSVHREYVGKLMSPNAVANQNGLYKLDRFDSVTGFGRWLRRTSLDELPQLLNVLRGDMSLVGPRPCIPYEAENFETHHLERFLMPQGITGLWQVTARANSTYREALDMDVAYVRGWSLALDVRLLLRTPLQLIRQRSSTA
jgi:exopolysaccharide biosynthesis polyprenyl glycosylphosphotransferase